MWIEIGGSGTDASPLWSSPTRGMWIEIITSLSLPPRSTRHPPHGGCGLKFVHGTACSVSAGASSPTRGMWIEIVIRRVSVHMLFRHPPHGGCGLKYKLHRRFATQSRGHPPHGGCGLKFPSLSTSKTTSRHPPHGGCGLKFLFDLSLVEPLRSSPTRGMWIEISR